MQIRITTLIENSLEENSELACEHGLSFFIEIGTPPRHRILFDTGQSGKFISNARRLNVDLSPTNSVVISHGHYDHSGGFRDFVENYGADFHLFVGQGFLTPKYTRADKQWVFGGNNFGQKYLQENEIKTTFVTEDFLEIAPGAFAATNFLRTTGFEQPNPAFHIFDGADYKRDLFEDEVVLVLAAKEGLVVLLGCSHPGVVNILETIRTRLNKPLYAVLGGSHLVEADEARLDQTFAYLQALNLSLLGLSHCTGEHALRRLRETTLPYVPNSTGTVLEVPVPHTT